MTVFLFLGAYYSNKDHFCSGLRKVALITSSLAKITFVGAKITFKITVISSSVVKITFVVAEITVKVVVITSSGG